MKRWQKWVLGIVTSLAVILGIILLEQGYQQAQRKQEMIQVVESEEVKEVIEEGLKNLDSKALTKEGMIQSYRVDSKSIKQNPMGGIMFTVYVNHSSELYVYYNIEKNVNTGEYSSSGGGYSSTLDVLLKEQ
ncbi:hypothetical protein BU202_01900 [Streptococcus cuniculi]|uniref:DUF1310 family protein n=1 Tax=Streptococcus cuniculi TaxID=1432788 RepID=A0A1Q8E9D4_9STRE|nr:DUF1310 family protein [Streptococcus cuniculi]OLF48395.1 hypothetical protein BU202_01900 [Streptococcus cuniculi]